MNTNWPDVFAALVFGVTLVAGLAVGAYLAINDHPWIGLLVILIAGSLRLKTGAHCIKEGS